MLALPNLPNQPKAQLYTLVSTVTAAQGETGRFVDNERDDQIVVNFPNLPDEIDIMRSSEWRVTQSPLLPDGFHLYDHTSPLEIPFTFKVHAFDDYAVNGAETILQIAAKLQALQLPIIKPRQSGKITRDSGTVEQSGTDSAKENKGESPNKQELGSTLAVDDSQYGTNYWFPPACVLNLMIGSGGPQALGICCVGYVKNVSTKLKGPWLNSGRADINRNLPSAGEYSFTFVHAPSYTNSLNFTGDNKLLTAQVGAYRMKQSFLNTIDILAESGVEVGYKGLK